MQRRALGILLAMAFLLGGGTASAQIVEYYHLDAVGNVRAITDAGGNVIERHDYLPFGEECLTGPCLANPGAGAGQPRKFTGKERDAETGLDYFGARYYGSRIGRFTTVDPVYTWQENILDPQRWNRYAYGRNNPFRYVDPDGRELRTTAQETVNAIAGGAAGRVAIRNGVVDTSGLTAGDLSGNEGAVLLNQMATSNNVYTYGEGKSIDTRVGSRKVNGGSNLDDRYDSRFDYKNGKSPEQYPPTGVDAAIVIDQNVRHLAGGKPVSPAAKSFHELAEAYGRVDGGMSYQGAHDTAAARERTLVGQRPGFTEGLAGASLTRVPEKKQ